MTRHARVVFALVLALASLLALAGCRRGRARFAATTPASVEHGAPAASDAIGAVARTALGCPSVSLAPLTLGVVEAAGCGSATEVQVADSAGTVWLAIPSARYTAARALGCDVDELDVTAPTTRTREVRGCGVTRTYRLSCDATAACTWRDDEAPFVSAVESAPVPAPVPSPSPETQLAARFAGASASLRRCAWGHFVVYATWGADGAVTYALSAPLAGTSAEACVRDAMGADRVYASWPGSLAHEVE